VYASLQEFVPASQMLTELQALDTGEDEECDGAVVVVVMAVQGGGVKVGKGVQAGKHLEAVTQGRESSDIGGTSERQALLTRHKSDHTH
jgi:hypothetical protein